MAIERLLEIMARLRDPAPAAPGTSSRTSRSIAPHTIEEAYEVADAIERADLEALRDELGDLLFQVAFHSRLAGEQGAFAFDDVVDAICDKLVRRHPHVFGDAVVADAAEQTRAWERMKPKSALRAGQARCARGSAGRSAGADARTQARAPARPTRDSTGRTRRDRARKSTKNSPSSTGRPRWRDPRRARRNSAICCSRW